MHTQHIYTVDARAAPHAEACGGRTRPLCVRASRPMSGAPDNQTHICVWLCCIYVVTLLMLGPYHEPAPCPAPAADAVLLLLMTML